MITKPDSNKARLKRHKRVRAKIKGTPECPRLNVYRSLSHMYAQIIDDVNGHTLAAASTQEKELSSECQDLRAELDSVRSDLLDLLVQVKE